MEDLYNILNEVDLSFSGSTLATIVKVTGSAYKKEGAAMLFKPDGTQIGFLSAGCLEEDLAEKLKATRNPYNKFVYDMREENDFAWGEGTGCNGVICVWTEKIDNVYAEHLMKVKKLLYAGHSIVMIKKLGEKPGYVFVPDSGNAFGRWEGSFPVGCRLKEKSLVFNKAFQSEVYIQQIRPKRRLIVFGAGADSRPLVSFAASAGFSVTVADWRPAFCTAEHFPKAEKRLVGFPHELLSCLQLNQDDCVVVMTHNFKRDQELLQTLAQKKIRYLGVLGSRKRTARLLEIDVIPPGIVSPAGLSIQAKGAEEIAISIVAQLIQISHAISHEEMICI